MLCHPFILSLTLAFSGAEKRAAMSPVHSQGSPTQTRGAKSQVREKKGNKIRSGCSPVPSRGAKRGLKRYTTLSFLRIPNAKCGEQNQKCSATKGKENQKLLLHPCLLGGLKEGGNATSPLLSWGSRTASAAGQVASCYLTPAVSGAQKWAEMLHVPCIRGDPQRQAQRTKCEILA